MPWYVSLFWLSTSLLLLAALRWGEWPEWGVPMVILAGAIATRLVRSPMPLRYHRVETGIAIVDLVSLFLVLGIAFKADRWWPLFATALLAVSMLGHIARLLDTQFLPSGYSVAGMAAYAVLVPIAIGIVNTQKRRKLSIT